MTKRLEYESGQSAQPFEALTDDGDHINFSASFNPVSDAAGHEPILAPYGLLTGGAITPEGTDNVVTVADLTVQAPGMTGADADGVMSVSSDTVTCARGVTNGYRITSITVDSNGALVAVTGTESTSFSETRAAAGGPPLIPDGSIEIGQVRFTATGDAAVLTTEIYTSPGVHRELADLPQPELDAHAGKVYFPEALPLIHTGGIPKQVWLKGSTPIFSKVSRADAWVGARNSSSQSSLDTYDGPLGDASSSLGQASFTWYPTNPITDPLMDKDGENIWFRYYHDQDKAPYELTQGIFRYTVTNPASGRPVGSGTITAEQATRRYES